jgi:hypothetical protein
MRSAISEDVVKAGRQSAGSALAASILHRLLASFHFMHVDPVPEMKRVFLPELLCLLKGHARFPTRILDACLGGPV